MLPDYANIVECPHCQGTKPLLSLLSGNTFEGCQWWDLKEDYPMLPHVSFVQKCPHCGKYFMLSEAKSTKGKEYSADRGQLSHAELREALAQMSGDKAGKGRIQLLLEYLWAYNDAFQRERKPFGREHEVATDRPEPTPEEKAEFQEVVRDLVATFPVDNKLIYAELLREAGLFDEAMEIVEAGGPQNEAPYIALERIIREKCARKDTSVGPVVF